MKGHPEMGSIKDVAAFIDPQPVSARAYRLAMRLAERWQARVIAVFSAPIVSCNPWLRGESIGRAMDEYLEVIGAAERRVRADFENGCREHGIVCEWRSQRVELARELVIHARYAGLSIVPRADLAGAPLANLPEQLILGSGRPTLLVPPTTEPDSPLGRCIALGWNESPEAARAVWDAMPLLNAAERVWVLVVDQDRNVRNDREKQRAEDLVAHLKRYDVKAEAKLLRSDEGDVSTVFRDVTKELSVDLLVLGAYSRARVSEVLFGGVTQWALRDARVPTLMSR